jgi:hypothetical protein
MKTPESKTTAATTAAKTSTSAFFSHEPQRATPFFGGEAAEAAPFFSPRTIQPKLTIGAPNDQYEQQADAVADQVVSKLNAPPTTSVPPTPKGSTIASQTSNGSNTPTLISNSSNVQAKCDHCEQEEKVQKKDKEISPIGEQVQMKPIFDSAAELPPDSVQRKTDGNTEGVASSDLSSRLSASKGGGQPLANDTRTSMESAMGVDFSNVRVHTGSEAVQMSQGINAQAFTHGSDVYFNEGKYDTGSSSGKHLLAHELTHTVQQGATSSLVQRSPMSDDLRNVWTTQAKGVFFERLRNLALPVDADTHAFVRETLVGDDKWLAQNLLTYGREASWPIHLRVEREMKGWGDSGGKGVVFEILRAANGSQASNGDLTAVLLRVFVGMPDDIWLAQNLQWYGREAQWPIHLKVQREMKGWGDSGGSTVVFALLRTSNGSDINNAQLTTALKGVFAAGSSDLVLALNLQTFGPEANWPVGTLTPVDNFAGRSTTDFGVGEVINLAFTSPIGKTAAELGGLKWFRDSSTSNLDIVTGGVDGLGTFTAGATNSTVALVLKGISGPNAGIVLRSFTINIVQPNDVLMVIASGLRHVVNTWSIGFKGDMFFRPMNVSFQNTQFKEGDAIVVASGYLVGYNGQSHCATNACPWVSVLGGNSATGSKVGGRDTVDTNVANNFIAPFAIGHFNWPIPWLFRVAGTSGAGVQIINASQTFTSDAAGTATASKGGSGTFTKNAADPTSAY